MARTARRPSPTTRLIKEKPLSPEAPGFQGRIVDIVLRMGNKERTVTQVRRLVKIMKEVEGSGVIKEEKDKKALEEAKELAERTLSNLAVTWHNEAKKTREEATFGYADMIYSDYLTLFPESSKAYDLRFFWAELLNDNLQKYDKAAANYTLVVLQDVKQLEAKDDKGNPKPGKPGKWLNNAAYNAVLAYDEVVKDAEAKGLFKDEVSKDIRKKSNIPPAKKDLLEACERYLKYVPKGDKKVEIAFKAANIYYRHNHFDEAVLRFSEIALGYPDYKFETGERAAEIAANLVLDSYNLLEDWAKVNEWARKLLRQRQAGHRQVPRRALQGHRAVQLQAGEPARGEEASSPRRPRPTCPSWRTSRRRRSPTWRSSTPRWTTTRRRCWIRPSRSASASSSSTRRSRFVPDVHLQQRGGAGGHR